MYGSRRIALTPVDYGTTHLKKITLQLEYLWDIDLAQTANELSLPAEKSPNSCTCRSTFTSENFWESFGSFREIRRKTHVQNSLQP